MDNIDTCPTANPNGNYNVLYKTIGQAMEKHIPDKIVKFNNYNHKRSKWITQEIVNSIAFRDKLHYKLKKSTFDSLEHETLKINLTTYNKILKKNIRIAKRAYYESCFEKYKNDMRKTWSTISDILNKSKKKEVIS